MQRIMALAIVYDLARGKLGKKTDTRLGFDIPDNEKDKAIEAVWSIMVGLYGTRDPFWFTEV